MATPTPNVGGDKTFELLLRSSNTAVDASKLLDSPNRLNVQRGIGGMLLAIHTDLQALVLTLRDR